MIDRKALWMAWALVAAMLAAAAWRVSLLADWTQLPRYGANGVAIAPINSVILLGIPAMLLFIMARLTWRTRTARDPGEKLRPWKKWASAMLVPMSVILTLAQALIITRSLGQFVISPVLFARAVLVIAGLLGMAMNNALPKLPWLHSRIAFLDLDPDKGAKVLRHQGRLGVVLGLAAVLVGLFLPFQFMFPVVLSMAALGMIMRLALRFSAKRSQPQ